MHALNDVAAGDHAWIWILLAILATYAWFVQIQKKQFVRQAQRWAADNAVRIDDGSIDYHHERGTSHVRFVAVDASGRRFDCTLRRKFVRHGRRYEETWPVDMRPSAG